MFDWLVQMIDKSNEPEFPSDIKGFINRNYLKK